MLQDSFQPTTYYKKHSYKIIGKVYTDNSLVAYGTKLMIITAITLLVLGSISYIWYSTYNVETHNCVHMSQEVHDFLLSIGIPSQFVYGHIENADGETTKAHCWLRIFGFFDFEATTLFPCLNSNYYIVDQVVDDTSEVI